MRDLAAGTPRPARRRGITLPWLLGFLCALLLASAVLDWLEATRKVDRLIHDGWVRFETRAPPDDVVLVVIDAESLNALGRWPWSRELQSLVVEQLARNGVRAAVIDVLHVEPDLRAASDARLADAIASLPVSILPVLVERGVGRAIDERLPLPVLSRAVSDLGHVVLPIDDDGIVRRVHLKAGFGEPHWSSLSLAALAALEPDAPVLDDLPGERLEESGPSHLWARDHEVLVPFVGPSGSFHQVSAAAVARGEVGADELEGRIAFFGLATTGLGDVVPTPVSALERPMPGIEMHANVFTALRDGTLVTRAPLWTGPLAALLVLPLMLLLYSRATPRWALPGALVGALLPILASFLLYRYGRLWFAPLSASVPILASYLIWSRHRLEFVNRFLERERAKFEPHHPRREASDRALAEFFEHATRHLPIVGWRLSTRDARFDGGERPPPGQREVPLGRWVKPAATCVRSATARPISCASISSSTTRAAGARSPPTSTRCRACARASGRYVPAAPSSDCRATPSGCASRWRGCAGSRCSPRRCSPAARSGSWSGTWPASGCAATRSCATCCPISSSARC